MASNQEESFSNLEDRNQMGTTCTATAPIYVEGTPSREIMFRLPPLENMGPSVTTEQSFGEGICPFYCILSMQNSLVNLLGAITYHIELILGRSPAVLE